MVLIERDFALGELHVALADVLRGAGRVALISGEAGIGKTSLVEQFAREGRTQVRILWGGCDALYLPRPLGPVHDLAAQAGGALQAAVSSSVERGTVFSAVLAELQRRPALVIVEDVHWADEASLDVLRYVGRRIERTAAMLVLTFREDELNRGHPLRTVLGDLTSSAMPLRIHLEPLSEPGVRAMVGERSIDAAALHRQTGGNPFFITEVLADTSGSGTPLSVRDAVLGRIARISSHALTVLEAAAVAGPRVESWLLAAMAPAEVHAADECVAAGMLVETGDGLAFRHELTRQAVIDSIAPLRRARLHQVALRALEESADLTRLAHHAEGTGDALNILTHLPAAARHAAAVGAHRAAADLLARSLLHAHALPTGERAALLEAHAMECYHLADLPGAIGSWRQAIRLWDDRGDRLRAGLNLAMLANALASAGQRDEARGTNHAAMELLEQHPPGRELALAYGTQAILHQYNHELAAAISLAERAIALAEQAQDTQILVMAYDTLGMSSMFLDYERGCRFLEHARDLAGEAGLDAEVARAYGDLGAISVAVFQLDAADRYLSEGLTFTAERDLDRTRLYTLTWQATADLFRGRWAEAATRAGEVLRRPASTSARLTALLTVGRLEARCGDDRGQPRPLDEALAIAGKSDELRVIGPVRAARAEAAHLLGELAASLAEADAVYRVAVEKRHHWLAGELAYWRWRAGADDAPPDWIATPFGLHIAGKWRKAAAAWNRLGCPYEEARALADGDQAAREQALFMFDGLGARAAAAELRRTMRHTGARRVPRGPRLSTRANRFGLTARQQEILALLAEGFTNGEIAERMTIAPKTAEHHVAAVLAKLQVASRQAAVSLAREEQLIG